MIRTNKQKNVLTGSPTGTWTKASLALVAVALPVIMAIAMASTTFTMASAATQVTTGPAVDRPATGAIAIIVTDAQGHPVKGAKVSLDDQLSTFTDADGKVGFSSLATGSHTVTVTQSGKTTAGQTVVVSDNQTAQLTVKLAGGTPALLPVVLAAVGVLVIGGAAFSYLRISRRNARKPVPVQMAPITVGTNAAPATQATPVNSVSTMPAVPASQPVAVTPAPPVPASDPVATQNAAPEPQPNQPVGTSNDNTVMNTGAIPIEMTTDTDTAPKP